MAEQQKGDSLYESRDDALMDEDRMVNEGLGGGTVSAQNGLIGETTTDTMDEPNSVLAQINRSFEQPEYRS
ncbi:hypothetical protein DUZ99_02395 [Xylanibacillus composti]|uniref:Uncharacterized protein n=1 Tax=Xylanibacillus composti TaxID=1572762 RepID=A0A8J4H0X5_9BACL|nr:hypothetical protein [Xylanibacillus composti]MDT9723845.1 hypothetical protein [Xylanibacillus composti]GIQ67376.1 hypothetical protein XYCOK13_02000 [Xylanibacillus composti]